MKRFCKQCHESTDHERVHVSAFGEAGEPIASRIFAGLFTAGMSELFSDYYLECQECGRKIK